MKIELDVGNSHTTAYYSKLTYFSTHLSSNIFATDGRNSHRVFSIEFRMQKLTCLILWSTFGFWGQQVQSIKVFNCLILKPIVTTLYSWGV